MKLLREKQVLNKMSIGKTLLWKLVRDGVFPQPVKITSYTTVWVEQELDEYILRKMRGEKPVYEPRA